MKTPIFSLCVLICFLLKSAAHSQNLLATHYYPGVPVDSVLVLSTTKEGPTYVSIESVSKKDKETLEELKIQNQKIVNCFTLDSFPLTNYQDYLEVYETKRHLGGESLTEFLSLFPKQACQDYPVYRCTPQYRDVVVFFNKGKAVGAIKICFSCISMVATPYEKGSRCLANDVPFKAISSFWLTNHWIDMEKNHMR